MPAVAVLALLDAAIFNLIAGNADAHGTNFSLLYKAGGVTSRLHFALRDGSVLVTCLPTPRSPSVRSTSSKKSSINVSASVKTYGQALTS